MPDMERQLRDLEIYLAGEDADMVRVKHRRQDALRWRIVAAALVVIPLIVLAVTLAGKDGGKP